jgi:hypothetical protein
VGLGSIIPHGSITVPVTFGTPENYHTESVTFDVVEAALSQFICRLAERALLFFKLLQMFRPFVWTKESNEAF